MTDAFDSEKSRASAWFRDLRDQIVSSWEEQEYNQYTGPMSDAAP